METYSAVGAAGLVMDVYTGEVVAMTSLPNFDPHRPGQAPADARFNRSTLGVYEMGSVFKLFNTAIALETGKGNFAFALALGFVLIGLAIAVNFVTHLLSKTERTSRW